MFISLSGAFSNFSPTYGYGVAAENIIKGLDKHQIEYRFGDPEANLEIFWGHPPYEFNRSRNYKIGYTAWESTELKKDWVEFMSDADEIWSPSTWLSNVFAEKTGKPTFTYPHGIDKEWKPFRHYLPQEYEPFRFLHIGEPQVRKNGQKVVDAFGELFGNNEKYQLVMKTAGINTTRVYSEPSRSILGTPNGVYKNIIFIDTILNKEQLIELHNKSHCLLYPTAGEGFGFHPLEAAASGLPTISTVGWCDYKEFISVPINAELSPSPWQDIHPGSMFDPSVEQIKEAMLEMVENYDKYAKEAFKNSFKVHEQWNWDVQNAKAAEKIKDILFSRLINQ